MKTFVIFVSVLHLISARPQATSSGSSASSSSSAGASSGTANNGGNPPLNLGAGARIPFPFGTYAGINIPGIIRLGAGCQDNGQGCNAGIQGLDFLNNFQRNLQQAQQAQAQAFENFASSFNQAQSQPYDQPQQPYFPDYQQYNGNNGGFDYVNNGAIDVRNNLPAGSNPGVFASSSSSSTGPDGNTQVISTRIGGSQEPSIVSTRIGGFGNSGGQQGVYASTGTMVGPDGKVTSYKYSGRY